MLNQTAVYQRVNRYVKNYQKEKGVKQSFIAQALGYTPQRFSELLNGRALMRIEDLENICGYFNVPATEFIIIDSGNKVKVCDIKDVQ